MKKSIIGALVGGIIIFIVQTLAWVFTDIHSKWQGYTPKQDSILAYLGTQQLKSGQYLMPAAQPGATMDEKTKFMADKVGKPWAILSFHAAYHDNMTMNMVRSFVVDVLIVWLLSWILLRINAPSFTTIFTASLFMGIIVYLNSSYTYHIWYETPGQKGFIIEYGLQWGLTGIWLGWFLKSKAGAKAPVMSKVGAN
jgi:hypothetical protein